MSYTVLIYEVEEDEGGGFWASVAELPGCFTTGGTVEEIAANVRDAIETYIEALETAGDPLPPQAAHKIEVAIA